MIAELPDGEDARRAALDDYEVLDTVPEDPYEDITHLASEICDVPISAISLVDRDRQWFKSKVGLDAQETGRDIAFCAHAILESDLMVVRDARADHRFADNPLVTGEPKIRFYAGAPLVTPAGHVLGTLCVIDRVERTLSDSQAHALRALSRQVMAQLELRRHVAEQERSRRLLEEANRRLELASLTDDVSGFHNTRFLYQYLERHLSCPDAGELSLVFFDMDGFKQVVDTHGHLLGAGVLREVAEAVNEVLDPDDRIVRYGGDEYVVILPGQGTDRALAKTEKMREVIGATAFLRSEGLCVRVTASFGLATFPGDAVDAGQLLAAADQGLFHSKARGRNRICLGSNPCGPSRS